MLSTVPDILDVVDSTGYIRCCRQGTPDILDVVDRVDFTEIQPLFKRFRHRVNI